MIGRLTLTTKAEDEKVFPIEMTDEGLDHVRDCGIRAGVSHGGKAPGVSGCPVRE